MDVSDFISYLEGLPSYQGQIEHIEHIPARKARYGELEEPLPPILDESLNNARIERLYSHQAEAINAIRAGHDVVIATSTASGKTLCYNLPALEAIVRDRRARALYIFPTKALAQDQLRSLRELMTGLLWNRGTVVPTFDPEQASQTWPHLRHVRFGTYDGDTPHSARTRLRKSACTILTNPDMLHLGILPNHSLWSHFFANLRYVVIDEVHVYRGVFGSQVACVLRRLRRLCDFYGSDPQFICCSATIANPGEHVERLVGLPVQVIDDDGSPQGGKEFVLWNPPFVDRAKAMRRSANSEATELFSQMVCHHIRNITFTKARKVAELILLYAREVLREEDPELIPLIRSYRAGYLPEDRREIERGLFKGKLLGVTATTALELGVDIGSLDATVLVGYPGTIASTWQQAGRAGRGVRRSLSILIGLDNPLDQYLMKQPQYIFSHTRDNALINPNNVHILEKHLTCAAYEMPLSAETDLFGPGFHETVANLERHGVLQRRKERWYYSGFGYPAKDVSIRSVSPSSFVLLDESQGCQTLEEIEATTAFLRVHPGAIYLHQGESYLVTRLDLDGQVAYLRPVDVDYYTQPRQINDVHIIRSLKARQLPTTNAYFGCVRVTEQVIGYRRKQRFTEAVLSIEHLDLPPQSFESMALWFDIPRQIAGQVARRGLDFHGGLHAVEHAVIGILPLFAMCDRLDIGGLSTPSHIDTGRPQVFIYDAFPGGVGISEKGFELLEDLWQTTLQLIEECPCKEGCPSCIQSPKCGNDNQPLDKEAAMVILAALLGRQEQFQYRLQ